MSLGVQAVEVSALSPLPSAGLPLALKDKTTVIAVQSCHHSADLAPVRGAPDMTGRARGQGAGLHVARLLGAVTAGDGGHLAEWAD